MSLNLSFVHLFYQFSQITKKGGRKKRKKNKTLVTFAASLFHLSETPESSDVL